MVEGEYLSIDQAALTGESLPVNKMKGNEGYSGSIVKQGDMNCVVEKTGANTFFGKTAQLVQTAGNISHFQESVINIGKFLIIGALVLAVIILAKELYAHEQPLALIQLVLVLLVASIPVAMPAVLSVTMALGALSLSKMKAIVSRLQAIEEMAGVDILCSDKTGTLTKNELTLSDPILFDAKSSDEIKLMGALASNLEGKDAIDSVIVDSASKDEIKKYSQVKFIPFDPVNKKTQAEIEYNGEKFTVIKGAPQVIIDACEESDETKKKAASEVHNLALKGLRSLGVAKTDASGNFKLLGILSLYDPPRDDSKKTIEESKNYGIDVRMVTGDDLAIAKEISKDLGLGTNIKVASELFTDTKDMDHIPQTVHDEIAKAEGFARVFPEHKYGIVKSLQKDNIVAMTGDGVNDAPALKQADVGIAVSGATDAARAAADLILTKPGLSVITHAVEEARRIFERMISYVTYRVAMTIDIMVFVTLSILFTNLIPLSALMIILLALLDDIPIMTIAYDNTEPDQKPVKWKLKKVLTGATILGVVSVAQNFGLLSLAKNFICVGTSNLHIQTMLFLQLVIGGHLLLFITRHKSWFWKKPYPSFKLLAAIIGTQLFAIVICKFGIFVDKLSWSEIGWVWLYCIIWMFILNVIRRVVLVSFRKESEDSNIKILNKSIY